MRAHAEFERGTAEISLQRLASALASTPARLTAWLAVDAGEAIGYATATVDFSTWSGRSYLHLDCLFVRADRRGKGVGKCLLKAVRGHARCERLPEIQWQTPAWNDDSIRFYVREGAVPSEKVRFSLKA